MTPGLVVFGDKRSLLKELVDVTVAGADEPVAWPPEQWEEWTHRTLAAQLLQPT
ncbi:hypothetical protein [Nonomuraea polychroma]|uniref:hypothetical protein n=1 Tax=Nonomuraea polychroma TaxID=46176 RepID=UPI0013E3B618|nr:hypothetical protein [Nonomuraea polychroma]